MSAHEWVSRVQGYAKSGQAKWAMAEVKWGTDYLLKTFKDNGTNVTLVYQVRDIQHGAVADQLAVSCSELHVLKLLMFIAGRQLDARHVVLGRTREHDAAGQPPPSVHD